jgi:hypothetical protein
LENPSVQKPFGVEFFESVSTLPAVSGSFSQPAATIVTTTIFDGSGNVTDTDGGNPD